MKEIMFRGKEKVGGEWVFGWYCPYPFGRWPLKAAICPSEDAEQGYHYCDEVDPNTIGEYTGTTDKNGKKIFEGDIVDASIYPADGEAEETHKRGVVVWDTEDCAFEIEHKDGTDGFWWYTPSEDIEVISNIYDNPELME